ncbi:MAG: hypothetical protein GQF41_2170 [Candidatus Rifleibacterium amylolyticum]|nr:MAG: hypothetical protein GQF41_2170 [Candidatus Rifleibacterium amylolyticum]
MDRRLVLVLLFAIVAFSGAPSMARMQIGVAQNRSGIDIQVTELMIHAMRARDMGDMNSAELFWIQARAYRPTLPRPAWLDQPPPRQVDYLPPPQDELLTRIASMPYSEAKLLLEKKLESDPANAEVRRLYLELAEANSDSAEMTRHRSVLSSDSTDLFKIVKYLLLTFLILAFAWQAYRLYCDLRNI